MVVMMAGIHISQEIFGIDVLTALKSSLEQRRKHVLRFLQLYGDQALKTTVLSLKYLINAALVVSLGDA